MTSPPADPRSAAHLDACPDCKAQWSRTARIIELARSCSARVLAFDGRGNVRTAVVAAAMIRPRRRLQLRPWLRTVAYGAASLFAGTVAAAVGMGVIRFERSVEIVTAAEASATPVGRPSRGSTLHRGSADASDPPSAPSPFGPEGPAATFGRAEQSTPAMRSDRPRGERSGRAGRAKDQRADSARNPPGPSQLAFAGGWSDFREGDSEGAAVQFGHALQVEPDGPLAEDARYWRAVALAQSGARRAARREMERFLDRYPGSPRAGEVSAMLGWLLIDDGAWDRAEGRFRSAQDDPRRAVRTSARAGLKALASRRTASIAP